MANKELVLKKLKQHYNEIILRGYNEDQIVGVFLFGSQNYNLDTEKSDIDCCVITLPTFNDIIYNIKAESTGYTALTGEIINVKDLRIFMHYLKKLNPTMLEILHTEYKILNPKYEFLWKELEALKEDIVKMNKHALLKALYGQSKSFHKYISKEFDNKSKKNFTRLLWIERLIYHYCAGNPYAECLKLPKENRELLINLKNKNWEPQEFEEIIKKTIKNIDKMIDEALKTENTIPNEDLLHNLHVIQEAFIKKALIESIIPQVN